MLKKFVAIVLILSTLILCLASCSEKYPAQPSSEKEQELIFTLKHGEREYEVKYELYRALFLSFKSEVDKGVEGVWSGEDAERYINEINTLIKQRLAEIFAIFTLADELGIDVYSKNYNAMVQDCIKAGVEGGSIGGIDYTGFGGDYEKYLESLRQMNLNYSVQDLLFRYALATDDIYYYYKGNLDNDATLGKLEYTRDDVLEFYNSEDCVRVMHLFLSSTTSSYTYERALQIREEIAAASNESAVFNTMMKYTTIGNAGEEISNGQLIGRHNLDALYYGEMTKEAFELGYFKTSKVINISTSINNGFMILYKIRKTDEHFEDCYEYIEDVYVEDKIGAIIDERTSLLAPLFENSDAFSALDYKNISMDN